MSEATRSTSASSRGGVERRQVEPGEGGVQGIAVIGQALAGLGEEPLGAVESLVQLAAMALPPTACAAGQRIAELQVEVLGSLVELRGLAGAPALGQGEDQVVAHHQGEPGVLSQGQGLAQVLQHEVELPGDQEDVGPVDDRPRLLVAVLERDEDPLGLVEELSAAGNWRRSRRSEASRRSMRAERSVRAAPVLHAPRAHEGGVRLLQLAGDALGVAFHGEGVGFQVGQRRGAAAGLGVRLLGDGPGEPGQLPGHHRVAGDHLLATLQRVRGQGVGPEARLRTHGGLPLVIGQRQQLGELGWSRGALLGDPVGAAQDVLEHAVQVVQKRLAGSLGFFQAFLVLLQGPCENPSQGAHPLVRMIHDFPS